MKFQLSILLFLGIHLSGSAQPTMNVNTFLATATSQKELQLQNKEIDFLKNNSHKYPWIQELEFRTRTRDFEISQQEYIFRATPNSPRQRLLQNKFHKSNIQLHELEQQVLLEDALLDRYEIILNLYLINKQLKTNEEFLLVYEDKVNVLRKSALVSNFDVADLLKSEDDLHELQYEILQLKNAQNALQLMAGQLTGTTDSVSVNTDTFITIPEIQLLISNQENLPSAQPIQLTRQQAKIDQLQFEYQLEDAERRNVLDFVESRYQGQTDDLFRERFSIGVGLKIPVKGDAKLKLNELKLEQLKEENEQQILVEEIQRDINENLQSLEMLMKEHDLLNRQLETSQNRYTLDEFSAMTDVPAYTLLRIKESHLEKEKTILEVERNIYETYLELIHLSGLIPERPLRNFLSSGFENL